MKTDFILAITQLAAERNLPKEVVFSAVEAALVSAFKKDEHGAQHNISVKINPASGDVRVFTLRTVVEKPADIYKEISLADAHKIKKDAQLGDTLAIESKEFQPGRIAAQTAKQVVLQRLREAEREFIFGEYADKEGDIVSGVVQRVEPKQAIIDLGKTEGVLPFSEQMRTERYRLGQRLRLYLLEVNKTNKGPKLVMSRSHPNLVRRLFELEVPEISSGIVEIKAVAREAGFRSKVAVSATQEGVDPVGSCVGMRGVRIQNIVNELGSERIDVIQWHPQPKVFIANSLSPAQVVGVEINEGEKSAVVVVPDNQLSLAIGKEGQNARLAAKLTGWKIDIKSATAAEAERKTRVEKEAPAAEAVAVEEPAKIEEPVAKAKKTAARVKEPVVGIAEPVAEGEVAVADLLPQVEEKPKLPEEAEEEVIPYEPPPEVEIPAVKAQIRFAEDIFAARPDKVDLKKKDKKKKSGKEDKLEGSKAKKVKKHRALAVEELEEELGE